MITARTFFTIALLVLVAALGAAGVYFASRSEVGEPIPPAPEVLSFEDCALAGYPVMESFPRRCATPDGRIYAEELPAPEPVYENASADDIRVTLPTPGAVVGREFEVRGEARGTWFFEASFPVQVIAEDGTVLLTTIGQPGNGEDWMTEDFITFVAEVSVPESYSGPATLRLMRDNPSGLPENDRAISFPITVSF